MIERYIYVNEKRKSQGLKLFGTKEIWSTKFNKDKVYPLKFQSYSPYYLDPIILFFVIFS